MIETFIYLSNDFKSLDAYETDFKLESKDKDSYKKKYQEINKACKENGLEVPYVFFENKVYFLAESESISDKFISLLGLENINKENVVLSLDENEILFMRLVRKLILLKTSSSNPQMTKFGLAYPIETSDKYSSKIERKLNASFSVLYGSNIIQIVFDLKSMTDVSWSSLNLSEKAYCSPSPHERYKTVKEKIKEIFGSEDEISFGIKENSSLKFKRLTI